MLNQPNIFNTNLKQFVEVQSQQSTLVFNPNGKTIVRSIRGVANTCASFVEKKQLQPENHSGSLLKWRLTQQCEERGFH